MEKRRREDDIVIEFYEWAKIQVCLERLQKSKDGPYRSPPTVRYTCYSAKRPIDQYARQSLVHKHSTLQSRVLTKRTLHCISHSLIHKHNTSQSRALTKQTLHFIIRFGVRTLWLNNYCLAHFPILSGGEE